MSKKWLDNPITWRKYFKLAGVCTAISIAVYAAIIIKYVGFTEGIDVFRRLLKKINGHVSIGL